MPVTIKETVPGFPVLEIEHPAATGQVALQGGQVLQWTPAGELPVLYLSPESPWKPGKAVRGGIPICWPWFGPAMAAPGLPSHGFARTSLWEFVSHEETSEGILVRLTLSDSESTRALWPHAFHLDLAVQFGRSLVLALRMTNRSESPVQITGALHSYFAVGDVRQSSVHGLDGCDYLDTTGAPAVRQQDGPVWFEGEVDRDYDHAGAVVLRDRATDREIHVTGSGSRCTVVWNPWIAKAASLPDLPDDGYQDFVCVETANAWRDVIHLPAGVTHTLGTSLHLVPLSGPLASGQS